MAEKSASRGDAGEGRRVAADENIQTVKEPPKSTPAETTDKSDTPNILERSLAKQYKGKQDIPKHPRTSKLLWYLAGGRPKNNRLSNNTAGESEILKKRSGGAEAVGSQKDQDNKRGKLDETKIRGGGKSFRFWQQLLLSMGCMERCVMMKRRKRRKQRYEDAHTDAKKDNTPNDNNADDNCNKLDTKSADKDGANGVNKLHGKVVDKINHDVEVHSDAGRDIMKSISNRSLQTKSGVEFDVVALKPRRAEDNDVQKPKETEDFKKVYMNSNDEIASCGSSSNWNTSESSLDTVASNLPDYVDSGKPIYIIRGPKECKHFRKQANPFDPSDTSFNKATGSRVWDQVMPKQFRCKNGKMQSTEKLIEFMESMERELTLLKEKQEKKKRRERQRGRSSQANKHPSGRGDSAPSTTSETGAGGLVTEIVQESVPQRKDLAVEKQLAGNQKVAHNKDTAKCSPPRYADKSCDTAKEKQKQHTKQPESTTQAESTTRLELNVDKPDYGNHQGSSSSKSVKSAASKDKGRGRHVEWAS